MNSQPPALTVDVSVDKTSGYHFSYVSRIAVSGSSSQCRLRLSYTLPPDLFVDPYELRLQNSEYAFETSKVPDLELPVFALSANQSLFHLSLLANGSATVTVPLHARYGPPSVDGSSYTSINIPPPRIVGLCSEGLVQAAQAHTISVQIPLALVSDLQTVELGTVVIILTAFIYLVYTCLKCYVYLPNSANKLK